MPNIPVITSRRTSMVGGINVQADAEAFGAGIGRATQALGGAMQQAADTAGAYLAKKKKREGKDEELAAINAQFSTADVEIEVQQNAAADGTGIAERVRQAAIDKIEARAAEIEDPELRKQFRTDQLARVRSVYDRNVAVEANRGEEYRRGQANDGLNALINKSRSSAGEYDQFAADGDALIDAQPNISATQKAAMKSEFRATLADARFRGLLAGAGSVEDFDRLAGEMEDDKWRGAFRPAQYDNMIEAIAASKKAFISGIDAQARGAIESMEARSADRIVIPDSEIREAEALVKNSSSVAVQERFARLVVQQRDLTTYGQLPPAAIREGARQKQNVLQANDERAGWANDASALVGGVVSPGYLISKMVRESGGSTTAKNPQSSAEGLFQFIDSTWLSVIKNNAGLLGVTLPGGSPAEQNAAILAMKSDGALQAKAAAIYAADNAKHIQRTLGITPTDTDLYLAHFLGPAGAVSFLSTMNGSPDNQITPAGSFSQAQINANRGVFFKKDGTPRTFREVYNNIARGFSGEQTALQANRVQYLNDMAKEKENRIATDPMSVAEQDGILVRNPLQSMQDYARLGRDAATAASYYNIPADDMKPFTETQAQELAKQIKDGSADQVLGIMANLQSMGSGMARAAYKQLGQTDTTFEYAAGLAADGGAPAVAADVVRGQKRMDEDKSMRDLIGNTQNEINAAFANFTGAALSGVEPRVRDQIQKAALAHYVETVTSRGTYQFDPDAFNKSVNAVMGGPEAVAEVNGEPTVLPRGVSAPEMETALERMTVEDYVRMSANGAPPRYADGTIVDPYDIETEGKFRSVGANSYYIEMADGAYLTTGNPAPNGRVERYVFAADPQQIKRIARRMTVDVGTPVIEPQVPTPEGSPAPVAPEQGALTGFDAETGLPLPRNPQ